MEFIANKLLHYGVIFIKAEWVEHSYGVAAVSKCLLWIKLYCIRKKWFIADKE